MITQGNTSKLEPLDIIRCPHYSVADGDSVVVEHPTRGLLLLDLPFLVKDDDEMFTQSHKRAAFRSVTALEGKTFSVIGKLERYWVPKIF